MTRARHPGRRCSAGFAALAAAAAMLTTPAATAATAATAAAAAAAPAAAGPPVAGPAGPAPGLAYAFTVTITLAPPLEQGTVDGGRKRFIGITGGTVSGPMLSGVVLPGGGDWQVIDPDGLTRLEAHYALKADDGTVIDIVNPGVRAADPEVAARMARGEAVDPSRYYFRTTPRFTVAPGPHAWLRRSAFVATAIRRPDSVVLDVYVVR